MTDYNDLLQLYQQTKHQQPQYTQPIYDTQYEQSYQTVNDDKQTIMINSLQNPKLIGPLSEMLRDYHSIQSTASSKPNDDKLQQRSVLTDIEFEVRFGTISNNGIFNPSITLSDAESLRLKVMALFSRFENSKCILSKIWDIRFNDKKRLRAMISNHIVDIKDLTPIHSFTDIHNSLFNQNVASLIHSSIYEFSSKERVGKTLNLPKKHTFPYDIRFSLSKEIIQPHIGFNEHPIEYLASERLSYISGSFRVDITSSWIR